MEGNNRKTTNDNVYRYAKIDRLSLTSCNPYLSLAKAANKIKRMSDFRKCNQLINFLRQTDRQTHGDEYSILAI